MKDRTLLFEITGIIKVFLKMEDLNDLGDRLLIRSEEEEEEFRSCLGEEDDPRDPEELVEDGSKEDFDENAWKIFFKGASINDADTRLSGIGVVMERAKTSSVDQYQKKLEFYVEENLAELLALLDALMEALRREVGRVYAFTDSEIIYDQVNYHEFQYLILSFLLFSFFLASCQFVSVSLMEDNSYSK